ncbi:hypothetical protein RUM43_005820 [Polyplax serrata]|uniref:Uncharacterized protein n=1 Tax=Polyplax serrata TaxID=468196 RepID=A0AAN8PXQ3_POLSC
MTRRYARVPTSGHTPTEAYALSLTIPLPLTTDELFFLGVQDSCCPSVSKKAEKDDPSLILLKKKDTTGSGSIFLLLTS